MGCPQVHLSPSLCSRHAQPTFDMCELHLACPVSSSLLDLYWAGKDLWAFYWLAFQSVLIYQVGSLSRCRACSPYICLPSLHIA